MSQPKDQSSTNAQLQMEQLRPFLACILTVVLCIAIPIIALNFIMAWGNSPCLTQQITKYSIDMTLRTWLLVQAYVFIGVVSLLIIGILLACFSPVVGGVFLGLAGCVFIPIGLFNIAWTIVGAIMFWGQLYPAGTCHTGLNVYMFIILIMGCLSICTTCMNSFFPKSSN